MIFFVALLSIFVGAFLVYKAKNEIYGSQVTESNITLISPLHSDSNSKILSIAKISLDSVQSYLLTFKIAQNIDKSSLKSDQENLKNTNAGNVGINEEATSYEDELFGSDDEAEEVDLSSLSAEAEDALSTFLEVVDEAIRIQNQFSYVVVQGDKLKDVLSQSGISVVYSSALEQQFPELKKLQAGQQFYWVLDPNGNLEYINWLVSEKEEKIFERKADNKFAVETIVKKSEWRDDVLQGTIKGSLSASLKAVGLSNRQIQQLTRGLQWQVAMNKLKSGDKFAILVKREYVDGKVTDLGNVEAIHIITGNKSYYAIQAKNGQYYNRLGETLGKGFSRYPLLSKAKISSPFNPRRKHPVTRRIAPHKGVDFALPVGTPVIAPADGVVIHIAYQANGAGRYLKIRHGTQYTTVYMHLSRSLVKVGQAIKKGDRIAYSGNTGRSTGPHLHYEFHINGHPVNPMTVKLPTGSGMEGKERKSFLNRAKFIETKLKLQ